ncbi:c2h2-type zinc finger transcription factor [Gigaspora margarita]|uniref:C2h2-type zinc finger transcription factor n=1 Tax=Gigaspora margarita TaxID=4874 RepID=A0A8H4AD94_GIGMA|nr:c2h2-type zinc finger transcription factor [Gigaspora margarita]
MLVKLIRKVNWDKELRSRLQTIGIMHSGLMMVVVYMDNPHGYVCRIRRGDIMEVPDNEEKLSALLVILAAILNAKIIVRETMKIVQQKKNSEDIFKQAGRVKRLRSSEEIPARLTTPKACS